MGQSTHASPIRISPTRLEKLCVAFRINVWGPTSDGPQCRNMCKCRCLFLRRSSSFGTSSWVCSTSNSLRSFSREEHCCGIPPLLPAVRKGACDTRDRFPWHEMACIRVKVLRTVQNPRSTSPLLRVGVASWPNIEVTHSCSPTRTLSCDEEWTARHTSEILPQGADSGIETPPKHCHKSMQTTYL